MSSGLTRQHCLLIASNESHLVLISVAILVVHLLVPLTVLYSKAAILEGRRACPKKKKIKVF